MYDSFCTPVGLRSFILAPRVVSLFFPIFDTVQVSRGLLSTREIVLSEFPF